MTTPLKPRVGDFVTLKPMEVTEVDAELSGVKDSNGDCHDLLPIADIARIESRPWQKGDVAMWLGRRDEIIHIESDVAWIRDGGLVPLASLTRPEQPDAEGGE